MNQIRVKEQASCDCIRHRPHMLTDRGRSETRPYVDYYASISLVHHRDIVNESIHFQRRESLYRTLGVLPRMVRAASVLEIGPGPGHNSLYTASLLPTTYTLIDGNALGIAACRDLLEPAFPGVNFTFLQGFEEDVPAGVMYDLVLAEGMLSAQHDPADMARKIGLSTTPGGIYIITCMDNLSYVSEITRRLIGHKFVPTDVPFEQRVARLTALFAPHLNGFGEMSRSSEEWVIDNIVHPLPGPLFAIDNAIEALDDNFDFYGSSPNFVVDWRWYKRLHSGQRDDNGRAIRAYREHVLGLIDNRVVPPSVDPSIGASARDLATKLYAMVTDADFGEAIDFKAAIDIISELAAIVSAHVPSAGAALRECREILLGRMQLADAANYATFFGIAQQYVSFTRRHGPRI